MPKSLRITKATLYIAVAILILIFHEKIMPSVAFLVGGVILAYALEELIFLIAEKKFADMAESIIQIVLAILLFLAHDDIGSFASALIFFTSAELSAFLRISSNNSSLDLK